MNKHFLKSVLLLCALIAGSLGAWAQTYKLTQVSVVAAGNKYVFARNSKALSNSVSSSALKTTDFSSTGLLGTESYVWTLETADGGFYMKNESKAGSLQYLNNSSSTSISFVNEKPSIWTFAFTDGVALISNKSNSDRFLGETAADANTYKAYATSNLASYGHNFTVYLLEEEVNNVATPTFSVTAGAYTSAQNVSLSCSTDGATIYYTLDGTDPTNSSTQYQSAIPVNATTTIKAIAIKGSDASSVATATYTILPVLHDGTKADPYTIADARNAIDANTGLTDVYVTGIVCQGGSSLSDGAMDYWISDDGTETDMFEIYQGKGISGANFTSTDDVQIGDVVIVKGTITKYKSTYEFSQGSQIISLQKPVTPLIIATPADLGNFTYEIGNGPSTAQTFTVSGSNLTADLSLTLGTSDYEMSLTENSGYTNTLNLSPTEGTVDNTTVYVRLKADLSINASYAGTITLTSTGAPNRAIELTGSVTQQSFSWDLSTVETAAATTTLMTWIGTPAVMAATKEDATTDTNNYYPGTSGHSYSSTRFYKNSGLTITPISGYTISSIVFTATSTNFATALKESTWTNATAAVDGTHVTVTPTNVTTAVSATIGGTCGFTEVKVYYSGSAKTATIALNAACTDGANYFGTYSNSNAFVVPADLTVAEVNVVDGKLSITNYEAGEIVPANTGVMVSAATAGDKTIALTTGGTSRLGSANLLKPSGDAGIDAATMNVANTKFYRLTMHKGTTIGFWWGAENGAAFGIAANKAYLAVPESALAPGLDFLWFDLGSETTGVNNVSGKTADGRTDVYNLSGQRMALPRNASHSATLGLKKGLYIVNGKKVVVK